MVEETSLSIMTALVSMLASHDYSEMTKGYINVLSMRKNYQQTWTKGIMEDSNFFCAAFVAAPNLWRSDSMFEKTTDFIDQNYPEFQDMIDNKECLPLGELCIGLIIGFHQLQFIRNCS